MILETMQLNEEGKEEIRRLIEEELRYVFNGGKIKLDKDLLEELLFFKVKYEKDKYVKLPVWGGEFLEKIDLSEVDFSDVSYSMIYDICMDKDNKELDSIYNLVRSRIPANYIKSMVYYGKTNGHFNFKESFEYKNIGLIKIHGCNFNRTDLSNNDLDDKFDIIHGYFANSGLKISTLRNDSRAFSSDFTGVDLSYYSIDVKDFLNGKFPLGSSVIKDTGINITSVSNETGLQLDDFLYKFHDGQFDGCYINGVLVKPWYALTNNKIKLKEQYREEVRDLKENVKKLIKPYTVMKNS